jgi:COP9 signalosome complex subunit 1
MQKHEEQDFNLTQYLSSYTDVGKIKRCHFVATSSVDDTLSREAYTLCEQFLKNETLDTQMYTNLLKDAQAKFGDNAFQMDVEWLAACEQQSKEERANLDESLKQLKMTGVKEKIRQKNNEIGHFLVKEGNLLDGLKAYQQNKDYSSTAEHTLEFQKNMMACAMALGNWTSATNCATKLRKIISSLTSSSPSEMSDEVNKSIMAGTAATQGIVELQRGNYRSAANWFLQTGNGLISTSNTSSNSTLTSFSNIVSLEDIALYGSLCSLASFERNELDSVVLRDDRFRDVLDMYPKYKNMLIAFHESKYELGFQYLSSLNIKCANDIHLSLHYIILKNDIRCRVILQYFKPYLSVSLQVMANALATTVDELENECARLINEKKLLARIDSQKKVLKSKESDQRTATYQKVMNAGDTFIKNMHSQLLSLSLIQHKFVHRTNKGDRSTSNGNLYGMSAQDGDSY